MIFIITIAIILVIFIINLWIQLHHQDHPQMIIFLMARCWQWKREEISRCHVCWPVLAILRSYHNIIVQYYNITVNILISFFSIIYQRILTSPPQKQYSLPMSSHYHLFLNLHLSSLYASSTFPWSPSSTASLWSPPKQTIRPTSSSGWETMFGWRMKVFNRCSQYDYQHQFCDKLHCWIFLKTDNLWSLKFSPINICTIWPGALRKCWRGGGQELYLHPIQQGPTLPWV